MINSNGHFFKNTLDWRALINNFVFGGSVAIKVNHDPGKYLFPDQKRIEVR
jgi:hypothetical protein